MTQMHPHSSIQENDMTTTEITQQARHEEALKQYLEESPQLKEEIRT